MVRKRYQKVTREYCNQAIDLLIAYFIKLLSVSRVIRQVLSDTYLDRLHRSSLTDFTAYYSIAYYTSPKYIRPIKFGAHIANV
jgi:hypothetical protein